MGIGLSVFLIAVGAMLAFAVEVPATGIDLDIVGAILMAVGFAGFLYTLLWWSDASPWRRNRTVIRERYVEPTVYTGPMRDGGERQITRERRVIEHERRAS
jgi:hypothetical protein